jgi:electron transfer flavoprotein alpha subunit
MMAESIFPGETTLVIWMPGAYKAVEGRQSSPPAIKQLPAPALDHLRVSLREYITPSGEDIDISKETVLVGVGRGIQREDNLDQARELAVALHAELCATRPVIDQGWLPATRLVGKSGKQVKPKVYLALGISGAPEHTESITGSEMIIAVNTDPQAPIFNYARYGAQVDILDLLPVLTEKLANP